MSAPAPARIREPEIDAVTGADGVRTVRLGGAWDIRALEAKSRAIARDLARFAPRDAWELTRVGTPRRPDVHSRSRPTRRSTG